MKKLMIAAAAAAMIAGVEAAQCFTVKTECGTESACATAYKVAISLKTTALKGKTTKLSVCDDPECVSWRQQASLTINGLIWRAGDCDDDACGCDLLNSEDYTAAFWTKKGGVAADFAIGTGIIGAGLTSKKLEAYGSMSGDEFGDLAWAGFGSFAEKTARASVCDDAECTAWVKSISGGIAGSLIAPEWAGCDDCEGIEYTACCDDFGTLERTAAYGTIRITYDTATAKKLAKAYIEGEGEVALTDFVKLPTAAASDFNKGNVEPSAISIEE